MLGNLIRGKSRKQPQCSCVFAERRERGPWSAELGEGPLAER